MENVCAKRPIEWRRREEKILADRRKWLEYWLLAEWIDFRFACEGEGGGTLAKKYSVCRAVQDLSTPVYALDFCRFAPQPVELRIELNFLASLMHTISLLAILFFA